MRVDFSHHTGIPLLKRQNTFSVSCSFGWDGDSSSYLDAAPSLKTLRSENMRLDLSMGLKGLGSDFAQGTPAQMTHQFERVDDLLQVLYHNGTQPYLCYCYMPKLLQPEGGTWRSPPSDYERWKRLCADIAAHYAEKGWPLAAHEIWNEPDLYNAQGKKVFYIGTWDEFIRMYDYAARGIREANPLATVGGMSIAFVKFFDHACIRQFLSHVKDHCLPMDFLSYHNYGTERYLEETAVLNGILSEYGDAFSGMGLHLNEFHVRTDAEWKTETTGNADSASMAMQAIARLVDMTTVTSVNWATWRDNGEGLNMVDNKTGQRSAVYHALAVYNDMPIDRVLFQGAQGIEGLASADETSASVILYTRAEEDQPVRIRLDNLPFERVDVRVYAIDKDHSSIHDGCESDQLEMVDCFTDVPSESLVWSGTLGAKGIVYIKILPAGTMGLKKAVWQLADGAPVAGETACVVRKEYYFENRSSTMFSEFDSGSFTAWAGMGNSDKGLSKGSVVLKNLPNALTVTPKLYGSLPSGAACFLYAQYCNDAGDCIASNAWSQGENAWTPERCCAMAGELLLNQPVTLHTPPGFSGTLHLTWGIKDAGCDSTIKLMIDRT